MKHCTHKAIPVYQTAIIPCMNVILDSFVPQMGTDRWPISLIHHSQGQPSGICPVPDTMPNMSLSSLLIFSSLRSTGDNKLCILHHRLPSLYNNLPSFLILRSSIDALRSAMMVFAPPACGIEGCHDDWL